MLKYPVYVRSVTNLSDARYCAGMGVDMIGFCFDTKDENYVDPATALGIFGWITGVKLVAEFGDNTDEEIKNIIADLNPDFISIHSATDIVASFPPQNIIYKIDLEQDLPTYPPAGAFVLLENSADDLANYYANFVKKELTEAYKIILGTGFSKENIDEVQNVFQPYGFALKGGKEIAPGLKNFDELADILEAIEN